MNHWLSTGDGKTYGPFSVTDLQRMAAEGRVPAGSMVCAEGGSEWKPASTVLGGAAGAPPTMPTAGGQFTQVSLVGPIIATLCCCLVGGIISIVYASKANSAGARGDLATATAAAKASKVWLIVSIVIGVISNLISFIYFFLIGAAAAAQGR